MIASVDGRIASTGARRRSAAPPTARSSMRCARGPTRSWPAPARCATERYGPIIRDPRRARARAGRGARAEQPLAVIVEPLARDRPDAAAARRPRLARRGPDALRRRARRLRRAASTTCAPRRSRDGLARAARALAACGRSLCEGGPTLERRARRRVADRRAVPLASRRCSSATSPGGGAMLRGGAPADAAARSSCGCCSRRRASSSRATSRGLIRRRGAAVEPGLAGHGVEQLAREARRRRRGCAA